MLSSPEYRKLGVYHKSIDALVALDQVALSTRQLRPDLRDQLQRAATSIVLNIAEGSGEFSPSEKARFYRIARRSAAECQAILDVLDAIFDPKLGTGQAREATSEVGAMLTGLVKAVESRKR